MGGAGNDRSFAERYMPYFLGGAQLGLGAYGAYRGAQDQQEQNALMMMENRREQMNQYLAAKAMAQADLFKGWDAAAVQSAVQGVGATQLDPYARNRFKSRLQLARLFGNQAGDYSIQRGPQGLTSVGGASIPLGGLSQYIPAMSPEEMAEGASRFDTAVSALVPAQRAEWQQGALDAINQIPGNPDTLFDDPAGQLMQQQALRNFLGGGQEQQEGRGFWRNFARIAAPIATFAIPGVGPIVGGALGAYGNSRPGEFGWGSLAKGAGMGYAGGALMGGVTGTPWREAFNPNFGNLASGDAWRSMPFTSAFRSADAGAVSPSVFTGPPDMRGWLGGGTWSGTPTFTGGGATARFRTGN